MSYVVVDIAKSFFRSDGNGSLKAIHRHIVLSCIETTQANIVPYLTIIDSTLDKSPVESYSDFRLISIKMIGSDGSNSLDIIVVKLKNLLVNHKGLVWVIKQIMNTSNANFE